MLLSCTLVLQVKWGQQGLDESGGQFAAPAGLTEILLHPVKQPGVGVTWARWLVEVDDMGTETHRIQGLVSITFNVPSSRFMKV